MHLRGGPDVGHTVPSSHMSVGQLCLHVVLVPRSPVQGVCHAPAQHRMSRGHVPGIRILQDLAETNVFNRG